MGILKRTLKKGLYGAISNELVLGRARKKTLSSKVVVLMYHELAEDSDDIEAWTIVRKPDFVRQMEYLKTHFEVVSLEQAISFKGKRADSEKPLAVVTFDDGYAGNKKVLLPIVNSLGLPVSIFVATGATISQELYWYDRIIAAVQTKREITLDLRQQKLSCYNINKYSGAANWAEIDRLLSDMKKLQPLERDNAVEAAQKKLDYKNDTKCGMGHLTEQDIKEMAACSYITFGAHTHCHSMLPQLTPGAISETIMKSRGLLEKWTGKEIKYFAYPSGAYDQKVMDVLKKNGFECSLTTRCKPWDSEPLLEIPRIGVGRYDPFDLFKVRVSDALNFFRKIK